jgi:hypothetical protein
VAYYSKGSQAKAYKQITIASVAEVRYVAENNVEGVYANGCRNGLTGAAGAELSTSGAGVSGSRELKYGIIIPRGVPVFYFDKNRYGNTYSGYKTEMSEIIRQETKRYVLIKYKNDFYYIYDMRLRKP